MKKAVIVIDMPEHCDDCPFRVLWAKYHCVVNSKFCGDEQGFYSSLTKPSWCPLRPLPEKWEIQPYNSQSRIDWKIGYNNCLDDIQGIEDKNERENQWWAEHSSRFD